MKGGGYYFIPKRRGRAKIVTSLAAPPPSPPQKIMRPNGPLSQVPRTLTSLGFIPAHFHFALLIAMTAETRTFISNDFLVLHTRYIFGSLKKALSGKIFWCNEGFQGARYDRLCMLSRDFLFHEKSRRYWRVEWRAFIAGGLC